jgi:hypothetical protein
MKKTKKQKIKERALTVEQRYRRFIEVTTAEKEGKEIPAGEPWY